MCGILSILNGESLDPNVLKQSTAAGSSRGPESTKSAFIHNAQHIFHRLAINGLDDSNMMPLQVDDCVLICNGEIYNYHELVSYLNLTPTTKNDCEIIIHLYRRVGIKRTLELLDGEFSFVLQDLKISIENAPDKIYIARDPYGVRPLFIMNDINKSNVLAVASEMKVLHSLNIDSTISQFTPGSFAIIEKDWRVQSKWKLMSTEKYHNFSGLSTSIHTPNPDDATIVDYCSSIVNTLTDAVRKRIQNAERPIAFLLSGGFDSSIVAGIASRLMNESINTYSIGFSNSPDIINARIVATYIGSNHHEIILTEQEFLDAIPEVIRTIESFDTTTVRASVGNYLVAKHIAALDKEKVVLNGDGSDECCGGYLYFNAAPDDIAFDVECKRLLDNIHFFDGLRSDRSVSTHGLEPRTPFLDKTFVQNYLAIPACVRNHKSSFNKNLKLWDRIGLHPETGNKTALSEIISSRPTKLLIRFSFFMHARHIIPDIILWRTKEAFSDGVSESTRSWHDIIKEYVADKTTVVLANHAGHMYPTTKEQEWYRNIFDRHYPNRENVIPYFWMPHWVDSKDASARALTFYTKSKTKSEESNVEANEEH